MTRGKRLSGDFNFPLLIFEKRSNSESIGAIALALQKIPSTIGNIIKRGQKCKAKLGMPRKTTEKTDKNINLFIKRNCFSTHTVAGNHFNL